MNSTPTSVSIESSEKVAFVYRTGTLNYTYVCSHCNCLFTNITDILDHIETHFTSLDQDHINTDNEPYRDKDLVKATPSAANYIDHHSNGLSYKCKLCGESQESQDDLNHHCLTKHSGDNQCRFCAISFDTTSKLLPHLIDAHMNVTQLICCICSENFVCKTSFYGHVQNHGVSDTSIISDIISKCENFKEVCVELEVEECSDMLQCDICGSTFDTKHKLSLHMKDTHATKHTAVKRGMYMCIQCNRNIQGKFLFYAHQYEHLMGGFDDADDVTLIDKLKTFLNANILYDTLAPDKAFGCKICSHLSVKRRKNIETHILQEHVYRLQFKKRSEKKFPCEYCGQKFTLSHNMLVHKRIHTMERPYTCLICNKSFSHSSYMKYHERVHSGLKTFQCSTCGMSFKSKTKLNQHNKIHSSETTKCPICSKEFKEHRLNVHIKHVHQNEHRPYKCNVCEQAFKTAKTLKTHTYRHSGEKKYQCRFHCDERFTSTAGRRGHERSKHETH
ncbi:zinc finger protein OZF-like [Bradysia coprophila]|uniref:zinc finger protein OZF-like n=1 Tax=Bradysia coprophila TaxID=38358 RepID=UPI00187D9C5A|nr:zinc finger protein OZF-like [Bradysia coprophila]